MKTHKRKKYSRAHGRGMGTAGLGSRKNNRSSGNRGGTGMSGTGKRADHKKTLVTKEYGHGYFGKQGITSKGTKRDKRDRINVGEIEKYAKNGKVELKSYKILGAGEIKSKLTVYAKEASATAIAKVKKAGGEIVIEGEKEKADTKNL